MQGRVRIVARNYEVMTLLRIGGVKIESPVALAPMAGVTDSVFRAIARKMGVGLVFTEMVSSRGLLYNNERTREPVTFAEEERPWQCSSLALNPSLWERQPSS